MDQLEEPSDVGRQRRRRSSQFAVGDALNCFAGGVFLSTGLLHMLPDVRQSIHTATAAGLFPTHNEFPMAEFLTSVGFFVMLVLDEVSIVSV